MRSRLCDPLPDENYRGGFAIGNGNRVAGGGGGRPSDPTARRGLFDRKKNGTAEHATGGGALQGQDDAFDLEARSAEVEQQAEAPPKRSSDSLTSPAAWSGKLPSLIGRVWMHSAMHDPLDPDQMRLHGGLVEIAERNR